MICRFFLILLYLCIIGYRSNSQIKKGVNDTILVGAIVINGDTLPHIELKEILISDIAPKWAQKERRQQRKQAEAYSRFRYNVYYVYPYAVIAGYILNDVDSALTTIYSKDAKKLYKENKERELTKKFKGELENMSIEQGQILVKLIARETGKPCYQIIKELKGGFNAGLWQAVALLFSNNLRNTYDPNGEDATIEGVVQEILARGHFEMKR